MDTRSGPQRRRFFLKSKKLRLAGPVQKRALFAGALLFLLTHAGTCLARGQQTVEVRHALDGDSLLLADSRQVRLIGVNTPEIGTHDKSGAQPPTPQPLAREAQVLAARLTEGRRVTLTYETERNDHYGRELAHVTLPGGKSLEEELLKQGLGWLVAIPPNVAWAQRLAGAEAEARRARRGVWNEMAYTPIPAERLTAHDTGFRLVSGKFVSLRETSRTLHYQLAPGVTVSIPRTSWRQHFTGLGAPANLVGKPVIVRGWVTAHGADLRLRAAHPAMLTFTP